MPQATPFIQYNLMAFMLAVLVLLFIGIKFKIPLFLLFSGLICIDIAIELATAEAGIIPVTVFAVMGLYLGLTTLREIKD